MNSEEVLGLVLFSALAGAIIFAFIAVQDLEDKAEKSLHNTVSLHSDVKRVELLDETGSPQLDETGRPEEVWQTSQGPEVNRNWAVSFLGEVDAGPLIALAEQRWGRAA